MLATLGRIGAPAAAHLTHRANVLTLAAKGRIAMRDATVATTSRRALLAACERQGVDSRALAAAAGLRLEAIEDPDGRLPGECVAALWRLALTWTGDESLALRAAESLPFGAYRIIDFLAASAPTLGACFERVARFFPLINSTVELRISQAGGHVAVELTNPRDPTGVPRPYAEYALAVTWLHCRHAAQTACPLVAVHFAYPSPADTTCHERVFGCPVHFRSARTELRFAEATWSQPTAAPSTDLLRTLAEELIARIGHQESVETRVVRQLSSELRGGNPSLDHVARRLGMSARTLQRRLSAENLSFADVLDRTRRLVADCYVKEKHLALTEVACLLGFSEQSAFSRAFQRWYGLPPSRYRTLHTSRSNAA